MISITNMVRRSGRESCLPWRGMGRMACLLSLALCGPLHAADVNKGAALYAKNCAVCHGASGNSSMPGAPRLDQGEGMLRPDLTILNAIRNGKNAMPAFQGRMSDREIMDVIAFIRTLH